MKQISIAGIYKTRIFVKNTVKKTQPKLRVSLGSCEFIVDATNQFVKNLCELSANEAIQNRRTTLLKRDVAVTLDKTSLILRIYPKLNKLSDDSDETKNTVNSESAT